ncbi:NAD(P)-binding protein [Polychaeton citri CBS 116435]|uniref:NAD(P)-binding protein n=1 Tax=Polychaeton citri CBS 116435 TaxID=1314669 RepID=A0A9P4QDV6_9PEZI|nr:NAD(P)-binding protein [Polychaeton citri CBS 116435]
MADRMSAVQVVGDITSPNIIFNPSLARPTPQNNEILIRVYAAGVTGDEILWPELYETPTRIPGHDISGIVAAIGPAYNGPLKVGDEVFALLAAERGEGQAEYAICAANEVALKPASTSHAQAAAMPIPFLTAWEAMIDHAKILPNTRVLVTGASGAVGRLFVQLATHVAGADVTALASIQNYDSLKQLGARTVVSYLTPDWERLVANIDVVFDTVGGDVLKKSWETVTESATIVTVADPPPPWAFSRCKALEAVDHPGVTYTYFIVSPNVERLEKASEMIDNNTIKATAVKSFPLHEAALAWSYAQQRGRGQKVVINLTDTRQK